MPLNIVVCVKIVPKPEEVRLDPETSTLDRNSAENVLNPSDKNALEFALCLKEKHGGRITLLSMGPPFFDKLLRVSMAMGADDAVLLTDRAFAGADTYPTSLTLAEGIRKLSDVDLVLCGEESADGGTGQVPPGIAEWLGIALTTYANEISYDEGKDRFIARRSISGGNEVLSIPRPAVISVELGVNSPRFPNFNRIKKLATTFKVTMWSAEKLGLEKTRLGLPGSHTTVDDLVEVASADRKRQFVEGTPQEIASKLADIILDHGE
jgi:electron transfer flavoprotein beta subunit